jgi:hypothetical protein
MNIEIAKKYLFLFLKWLLEIGRNIRMMLARMERWKSHFYSGFLLGLFFDPEDGGDMFPRNVG